jgi:hypothetical protein
VPLSDDKALEVRGIIESLEHKGSEAIGYRGYYDGLQARMISNRRLRTIFGNLFKRFRLNLCKPVVDSLADRLQVQSFSSGGGEHERALELWKLNRMGFKAGQLHRESISSGDGFVIVWPDEMGVPLIHPQMTGTCTIDYEPDTMGRVRRAAKLWEDEEKRARLNLYYPDRIEKYATKKDRSGIITVANTADFEPYQVDGEEWPLPNPYNVVPVFHFPNNADIGQWGVSELWDALAVQDMLNYLAFNMLVGVEFQSFRQRYAVGIEVPRSEETGQPVNPFKAGPEQVWIAEGADGSTPSFGEFSAADLNMLDNVKRSAALDMAQVTQTPPHYFFSTSNLVSGESQKTAEQKLDAKVTDRQIAFGDVWAQVMALAVAIESNVPFQSVELDVNWKDTKPRNEKESWEIAQIKSALGVSREQILREQGYTDEQIEEFQAEAQASGVVSSETMSRTGQILERIAAENGTAAAE